MNDFWSPTNLNLMKNLFKILCVIFIYSTCTPIIAQQNSEEKSPIYDRADSQLTNTDTIPDFRSKANKLKLTGTIYLSDGVTPAKDVILFIEHADENGNFDLRRNGEERYVFHRSWIKTDADGKYTFYTFIPGNDRRYNRLQEIYPVIKAPENQEYQLETFLFDNDPMLTKACRRKISKRGDVTRILFVKEENNIMVAQRDIVLSVEQIASK
jgi:protocatechuate 3,4-dioxygenase beta subunit